MRFIFIGHMLHMDQAVEAEVYTGSVVKRGNTTYSAITSLLSSVYRLNIGQFSNYLDIKKVTIYLTLQPAKYLVRYLGSEENTNKFWVS
jgi:hypothetical protein